MKDKFGAECQAGEKTNRRENGTSGANAIFIGDAGGPSEADENAEAKRANRVDRDDAVANAAEDVC